MSDNRKNKAVQQMCVIFDRFRCEHFLSVFRQPFIRQGFDCHIIAVVVGTAYNGIFKFKREPFKRLLVLPLCALWVRRECCRLSDFMPCTVIPVRDGHFVFNAPCALYFLYTCHKKQPLSVQNELTHKGRICYTYPVWIGMHSPYVYVYLCPCAPTQGRFILSFARCYETRAMSCVYRSDFLACSVRSYSVSNTRSTSFLLCASNARYFSKFSSMYAA